MSMIIEKPGLLTTVQDNGRYGYQQYGVIVGGAMDAVALRIANILVGNTPGAAGLEITILGPDIYFEQETLIAFGGSGPVPMAGGRRLPLWRTVLLPGGTRLRFAPNATGSRVYLAVSGGIDVPQHMNSRSTYLRAGIGGYKGRALQAGDRLNFGAPPTLGKALHRLLHVPSFDAPIVGSWTVSEDLLPPYASEPLIRVMAGPEADAFTEASIEAFFSQPYTVSAQSDRMGFRLDAAGKLEQRTPGELISSAVTCGTIQVPSDGNPIILMADRQTTGGYPRFAQVATVDLPVLAQMQLGATLRFASISLDDAQRQYILREKGIRRLRSGLELLARQHIQTGGE